MLKKNITLFNALGSLQKNMYCNTVNWYLLRTSCYDSRIFPLEIEFWFYCVCFFVSRKSKRQILDYCSLVHTDAKNINMHVVLMKCFGKSGHLKKKTKKTRDPRALMVIWVSETLHWHLITCAHIYNKSTIIECIKINNGIGKQILSLNTIVINVLYVNRVDDDAMYIHYNDLHGNVLAQRVLVQGIMKFTIFIDPPLFIIAYRKSCRTSDRIPHNELWHKLTITFCLNGLLFTSSKPDKGEDRHVWTTKSGLKSLAFLSYLRCILFLNWYTLYKI